MGYQLVREDEPLLISCIVSVIYGQPGIGKTSLGFTADSPLLEDYDDGVKRAVGRKDFMKFDKWEDAVKFHRSDDFKAMGIKTLLFDTGGTMLDNYIALHCIRQEAKNGKSGGGLTLQGYGALKEVFNAFIAEMKALGIDLIFICHQASDKDGDTVTQKPKMTGGSYDVLIAVADMVGYMSSSNNKRSINFEPTDQWVGKNTAEFPPMEIPAYDSEEYQGFMGRLIDKTKRKMEEQSDAQQASLKKVSEMRGKIEKCKDMETLSPFEPKILDMSQTHKVQLLKVFDDMWWKIYTGFYLEVKEPVELDVLLADMKDEDFPKRFLSKSRKHLASVGDKLGFEYDTGAEKWKAKKKDAVEGKSEEEVHDTKATEAPKAAVKKPAEKKKPEPEAPAATEEAEDVGESETTVDGSEAGGADQVQTEMTMPLG